MDGYSPIYTPDSWSEGGGEYKLGTKGLLAWWVSHNPVHKLCEDICRCLATNSLPVAATGSHGFLKMLLLEVIIKQPFFIILTLSSAICRAGLVATLLAVGVTLIFATSQINQ